MGNRATATEKEEQGNRGKMRHWGQDGGDEDLGMTEKNVCGRCVQISA
jgi:hypothetical protein